MCKEGMIWGRKVPHSYPYCPACSQARASGQASREDAVEIQGPRDCIIHMLPDVPGNKSIGEGRQLRRGDGGRVEGAGVWSTVGECGWLAVSVNPPG